MNARNNLVRVSLLLALIAALTMATPALAYFAPSTHQAATLVLGQPNFTSHAQVLGQKGMLNPIDVAVDPTTHKVFVADWGNSRVLRFASIYALANGAAAEAVLGQVDFISIRIAPTQNGMDEPSGVFVDAGGRLWVADTGNNRVLRFDNASTIASGANANVVLGQPNFTSHAAHTTQNGMNEPWGVFVDGSGRLWVMDRYNSRVLRFNNAASKANGANADGVLGQTLFTSGGIGLAQNRMFTPSGIFVDAGGRLWVADTENDRVLRFNSAASKANGANADGVLGQPNFTSNAAHLSQNGMGSPTGVAVDNSTGRLYVADSGNNRILVFNSAASLANGANASNVLGQTNFTTGTANTGGLSAATLNSPWGIFYDQVTKVLLVADYNNNRVLMYGKPSRYFPSTSTAADDGWVLESTEISNVGGSMSAAGTLRLGDDASNRQYRSLLYFDTTALPDNAVIRSVTLKIHKAGVVGADPLTTFGPLLADMKKGTFGAPALEIGDFQAPASAIGVGHYTAIASQPGWYQMVLPAIYYNYVNLTGVTQFRLRFTLDDNNNHIADYDTFYAGDAASSTDRPLLSIEYSLP